MRLATSSIASDGPPWTVTRNVGPRKKQRSKVWRSYGIGRVLVKAHADDDHEQVAGKLLELGPAVHRERVFDRERVQSRDALQQVDLRRIADVDVDPNVAALAGDRLVDLVERQAAVRRAGAVQIVAAWMYEIGHDGGRGRSVDECRWVASGPMYSKCGRHAEPTHRFVVPSEATAVVERERKPSDARSRPWRDGATSAQVPSVRSSG